MTANLHRPEELYRMLNETFLSNPMVACTYNKDSETVFVRQFVSPQTSIVSMIARWGDSGYCVVTRPLPLIAVPDESRENFDDFILRSNARFERGLYQVDESGILFRTHIACSEGDDMSRGTMINEICLGIRIFMSETGDLIRAIDGETYDEINADEAKGQINASAPMLGKDSYIPAAEEKVVKDNGGMYV